MPNTASAKKRLRQNVVRRQRNRSVKSSLRTQVRKVRTLAGAGNVEEASTELRLAAKKLDKAASENVIHRNKAARLKSRLHKLIKSSGGAKAAS